MVFVLLYILLSMKIRAQIAVVLAGMTLAGVTALAQGAAKPLLLVVNQGDHTLSLIDPETNMQIAAVPVGGVTGHEVATTPDGKTAFVPIYGDAGVGRSGTDGDSMAVIDLAAHKVAATVDFGHGVRPHMPYYDRTSGMLYVSTELDKAITIIDPKTLNIVGKIPTGQEQSHMFVLSPDGTRGYTANVGPGTVSVLDMVARTTIAIIPVSAKIQRISISHDGRMVFTADQTKPQMAVIDTATNTVKAWIPLPAVGYGSTVTLNGRWLLVQMGSVKQVAVINLHTMKVARTIDVCAGMGEILVRPDGKVAYASCPIDGKVAQIDLATWKVVWLIDAGKKADGLGWAQ
jgi:YVTN family beta-propeller protein